MDETQNPILAYNVKTKTRNVPMQNAVIDVKNGRYIVAGDDGKAQ